MSLFSNNFHGGIIIRQIKRRKEKGNKENLRKTWKTSPPKSRREKFTFILVVENIFQNGGENNISCLLQALVTIY